MRRNYIQTNTTLESNFISQDDKANTYLDKVSTSNESSDNDSVIFKYSLEKVEALSQTVCSGENVEWCWQCGAIVDVVEPKFCSSEFPLHITVLLQSEKIRTKNIAKL